MGQLTIVPDEVRAVLGVSSLELKDSTLALPIILHSLYENINSLGPTLLDTYDDITNRLDQIASETPPIPLPVVSRAEQRFVNVMQVYAASAVASILLTGFPMFAPRRITDGRATMDRFNNALEESLARVEQSLYQAQDMLAQRVGELGLEFLTPDYGSPLVYVGIAIVTPDPVTGA